MLADIQFKLNPYSQVSTLFDGVGKREAYIEVWERNNLDDLVKDMDLEKGSEWDYAGYFAYLLMCALHKERIKDHIMHCIDNSNDELTTYVDELIKQNLLSFDEWLKMEGQRSQSQTQSNDKSIDEEVLRSMFSQVGGRDA